MKKFSALIFKCSPVAALCLLSLLAGCNTVQNDYENQETVNKDDFFDFKTVNNSTLTLNLDVDGETVFYLYEENPVVTLADESIQLNTEIEPIYADVTDAESKFTGVITLPIYLKKVWLVVEHLYFPLAIELNVTNSSIFYDRSLAVQSASTSTRAIMSGVTYPNGYDVLGGWSADGIPDYLLTTPVPLPTAFLKRCNDIHSSIIGNLYAYDSSESFWQLNQQFKNLGTNDMVIKKNTELVATYFRATAGWDNMVAYYTYQPGETVTLESLATMKKTILFPRSGSRTPSSLLGKQVKLKYWNKQKNAYQNEFPAGTRIGWIVLGQGFGKLSPLLNYSNPSFNSKKIQNTILMSDPQLDDCFFMAIEDFQDYRFNDVLFSIISSQTAAVEPAPVIPDPVGRDEISYKVMGTLVFEDNWPKKGDYDMNDVVVIFKSTVSKQKVEPKRMTRTTTTFYPVSDGATYLNGFGIQFDHVERDRIESVSVSKNGIILPTGFETGSSKPVILLFNEIGSALNTPIIVDVLYKKDGQAVLDTDAMPPYNPFIFVNSREHEVHLTGYIPTSKSDDNIRGTEEDLRQDSHGNPMYYVAKDNMPFALHISGSSFNYPAEGQDIRIRYPKFSNWVKSFGKESTDWYK